jgi:hypothetical protein
MLDLLSELLALALHGEVECRESASFGRNATVSP